MLAFSEQAGLQVLVASTVTRHRRSQSVRGRDAPTEPLVLLPGSEALQFRYISANTVAISAAGQRGKGRVPTRIPTPATRKPGVASARPKKSRQRISVFRLSFV